MSLFHDEELEVRPIEELIKLWPETWEKFDHSLKGINSEVGSNAPEGSALQSLLHQPIQEMLKV